MDSRDQFFEESNFSSAEDIFSVLEALESATTPLLGEGSNESFEFHKSAYNNNNNNNCPLLLSAFLDSETEAYSPNCKRQKLMSVGPAVASASQSEAEGVQPQARVSHITVERNRRKQMNEHLSVLRSLMPCFYVKRVCACSNCLFFLYIYVHLISLLIIYMI